MESCWAGSFPASGTHLFTDPLDGCSSSSIPPAQTAFEVYSASEYSEIQELLEEHQEGCSSSFVLPTQTAFEIYSACEYSEIQELLEEPQDESHLPELFGIASSLTSDDGMTIQTCTYVPPEIKNLMERSPMPYTVLPEQEEVLGGETGAVEEDFLRLAIEEDEEEEERREGEGSKKGSGARGPRKRGEWKSGAWFRNHFLNKGQKRENNKQWTPREVKLLVEGISKLGPGHWRDLKDGWFSDSGPGPARTAVHLKDKWRNLVKAYVLKPSSKKKGQHAHLDKQLINNIRMLAAKHPYPK